MPIKEEIVILFVSTYYSNFDSKSISITTNSLLSNVKESKLKKDFDKCKVIYALKPSENLMFKIKFLKGMVCITMNVKIPALIYVHCIYKNVQVS